ncbi:MAG: hypothetical protein AAF984_07120 [Verrucomicrobiota bacterium]
MKTSDQEPTSKYDISLLADLYGDTAHSPLRRHISQIRHELRRKFVNFPALYVPFARWKYPPGKLHRPEALLKETNLVIEGYPRSGNSFAFTAFNMAQGESTVRVAHHLHTASVVIAAIRANVPSLLLVRNPEDAIISHIIYSQNLTIRQCLRSYLDFYQPLLKYKDYFVVAKFEDVITDFGAITRQVNEKFSTSFREFDHIQDNVDKCFYILENSWKDLGMSQQKAVTNSPSEKRKQYKGILRHHFRSNDLKDLRERAFEVYQEYV